MNQPRDPSGRSTIASAPRTSRFSLSAIAMGHSACGIHVPSGRKMRSEPHHASPSSGRRPQKVAAASLKNVIRPRASVV